MATPVHSSRKETLTDLTEDFVKKKPRVDLLTQEAAQIAFVMRKDGKSDAAIALELGKLGYKTWTGNSYNADRISWLIKEADKRGRTRKVKPAPPTKVILDLPSNDVRKVINALLDLELDNELKLRLIRVAVKTSDGKDDK